jgi:hypothetical protein
VLVDQAPQIRRFRITWLVEGRQFGTGQSHEQHATSPTGGRASQSRQPILGSLTDCVVCNRRKVMMYACSLTVNAGQPLMAAQRWDHESYVARFTGKSCGPVWKTCQQWLVEDCLEVAKVYVWPKNSVAATWTLSNRPSDSGAHLSSLGRENHCAHSKQRHRRRLRNNPDLVDVHDHVISTRALSDALIEEELKEGYGGAASARMETK